jgi:Cof subfamily protein (haloacid dehalogenase superfamily)
MGIDYTKIKMVVSDMDGTLLNASHEVSPRFFELFTKLKKRNIRFVAASGRQYPSMRSKLTSIADEMSFIAENGALIIEQEKTLHTQELGTPFIHRVVSQLQELSEVESILCSERTAYSLSNNLHFHGLLKEYYEEHRIVKTLDEITDPILKIALYHKDGGEQNIYPHFRSFEEQLKVKVSGDYWVDISDMNANKGYALEKLLSYYKLTPDELIVFGDYNNDLEMLALTPNSVAMDNAHPAVLKAANYRTSSHTNHGVERILEELLKH